MEKRKRFRILNMLVILLSCISIVGNKGYIVNAQITRKSNDLFYYYEHTFGDSDRKGDYVRIVGIAENADKDFTSLTIPSNIDGVPVKRVGLEVDNYADERANNFDECKNLKTLILEDGIESIDDYVFSDCSNLENITLPESLRNIAPGAFSNCKSLKQISIPASVTGFYSLYDNDDLSNPFFGCSGLTSISVDPNNPKFYSSKGADNYNAIIYKGDYGQEPKLIAGCANTKIPSDVTIIGKGAFGGCSGLTSIEIPDSVTRIASQAFDGCSGLTSIEIPNGVKSIEGGAFDYCSGLTSIVCTNIA